MVKYLKTRKGQFYKLMKNGKKKRISQREYRKKKTRKNIKMIGGVLEDIEKLDVSEKVIILIGDFHTILHEKNIEEFNNIIERQKEIIDIINSKYDRNIYFYTELPLEDKAQVLRNTNMSTCIVTKYALNKMPLKFSNIDFCDREKKGHCDREYADDILDIFREDKNVNCVVALVGFSHLSHLKRIIGEISPEIKIVCINTLPSRLYQKVYSLYKEQPHVYAEEIELLEKELPYVLKADSSRLSQSSSSETIETTPSITARPTIEARPSIEATTTTSEPEPKGTYDVQVLRLRDEKVFKCPACGTTSGTFAARNPTLTHLFKHKPNCPNQGKIPIEPSI